MTRVDGVIPRRELGLDLSAEQTSDLCGDVWDVLVRLHSVDLDATGLRSLGKGEGYVARQVSGWTDPARQRRDRRPRRLVRHHRPGSTPHQPADVATCLIHNDFRLDNLVLDAGRPDPRSRPSSTGRWPPSATR